jgi:hypothetical protein
MKSALRTAPAKGRGKKRVRFAGAQEFVVGAPPPIGEFQFARLATVSTRAATPLFTIAATGTSRRAKGFWGEGWPAPPPRVKTIGGDSDDEYETVLEWFCDKCGAAIDDGAARYECATCPAEYCQCAACYRAGVISDARHAHPLVPSSAPHHITQGSLMLDN